MVQSTAVSVPLEMEDSDTGRANTQQLAEGISLPNLLPSAIENIEESSSHASMKYDLGGQSPAASVTEPDPKSQRPQSPDYSPSLLKLLVTDNSSSGESLQSYVARKLVAREENEGTETISKTGPSNTQIIQSKTSVSEAITITPVAISSTCIPGPSTETPVVTFLGPPGPNSNQAESEHSRCSTKRP